MLHVFLRYAVYFVSYVLVLSFLLIWRYIILLFISSFQICLTLDWRSCDLTWFRSHFSVDGRDH
jgi:hypothetical protein